MSARKVTQDWHLRRRALLLPITDLPGGKIDQDVPVLNTARGRRVPDPPMASARPGAAKLQPGDNGGVYRVAAAPVSIGCSVAFSEVPRASSNVVKAHHLKADADFVLQLRVGRH
jgi:hypothetical protein